MNKHPWYYYFTFLYTFPCDIITWVVVLFIWLLWGTNLHWLDGVWCELKKDSWPSRTWYKKWAGTTLGHGGFLASGRTGGKGIDTCTEFHEHIHVEQFEGAMLRSFITTIAVGLVNPSLRGLILAGVVWVTGGILSVIANTLQAKLRGEEGYKGSTHEESAYAQQELWDQKKRPQS